MSGPVNLASKSFARSLSTQKLFTDAKTLRNQRTQESYQQAIEK